MLQPLQRPTLCPYTTLFRSRLRDRQRDGIAQVLALNELRARRHCDGTGERDKCEAGCNHGRSSGFELSLAVWVKREGDRKSTRLNSSHTVISYAVFCLKKKS